MLGANKTMVVEQTDEEASVIGNEEQKRQQLSWTVKGNEEKTVVGVKRREASVMGRTKKTTGCPGLTMNGRVGL